MARIQVYPDSADEHRWRKIGDNDSDIIADSAEGYSSATYCLEMALKEADPGDRVEVLDEAGTTVSLYLIAEDGTAVEQVVEVPDHPETQGVTAPDEPDAPA